MNQQFDPSQLPLRDIHLPDPVAWWPPAFGWWILAASLLVLGAVLALRHWRMRRHRAAQRSLAAIMRALETGTEPAQCAREASIVLRRFAMTIDRRSGDVAGLAGEPWLTYLSGRARAPEFAGTGELLLDAPYRAAEHVSVEQARAVCEACNAWIKAQPAEVRA